MSDLIGPEAVIPFLIGEEGVEPPPEKPLGATLRERPPSRLSILVETPTGRCQRWGEDDPDPRNSPTHMTFGSAMPGGFDRFSCVLQRDPTLPYFDLEMLSKVTVMGPGGTVAWQGRLEKTPDVAGYQAQITPEAVGYQAALEDDNTAREIFIDGELAKWEAMHNQRKINWLTAGYSQVTDPSVEQSEKEGQQVLSTAITSPWTTKAVGEAWYDPKGIPLGALYYSYVLNGNIGSGDGNWTAAAQLSEDDVATAYDIDNHNPTGASATGIRLATTANRVFASVQQQYNGSDASEGIIRAVLWKLIVFGNHGLPRQDPELGLLASDIVRYAVQKWAPEIDTSEVVDSSFHVPQLAFLEPTTCAEMIKQATRFELPDWAVWEGPTLHMNPRNEGDTPQHGNQWRARVGPAQLQEAGQQISRLWNGVAVQYTDAAGKARMVGPPDFAGNLAGDIDPYLLDGSEDNPLNQLGIRKWALLRMGTSTAEGAKKVGQVFLNEQAQLGTSGQASIVGYVEDGNGQSWPPWMIRAGDVISFVDSTTTGPRRIISVAYDHGSRTATLQLDQPPEGMQALLERLSVSLIGLGLS